MRLQKNIQTPEGKVDEYYQFESMEDLVHWASNSPIPEEAKYNSFRLNSGNNDVDFSGVRTYEECQQLAQTGWEEGVRIASGLTAVIEEKAIYSRAVSHEMKYEVAGGVADVGVFLSNDPECFLKKDPMAKEGAGKLIRLNVNISTSACYTSQQMMRRGVAVMSLVDLIERTGRSAEIVATIGNQDGKTFREYEVTLKRFGQQMDLDKIAFALAHPSFYRRILFACFEISGVSVEGHGCPEDVRISERGDYYFPAMSREQCPMQDEQLAAWVIKMLSEQGIEIEL
jgi:hypothetical protein